MPKNQQQKLINWTQPVSSLLFQNLKLVKIDKKNLNNSLRHNNYVILEELGRNSLAGRVTFKAKDNQTGEIVVIKKFQFLGNSWDGYKLIEKEIKTLSKLDHPNIPKYLGQYEDEQGVCLVQEYIDAPSLASFGQLPLAEVTDIALSVLDILAYLQELSPPVFHRDIKPENILYNRETKQVYLVDFGVAKTGTGTTTSSTINGGTWGFMPPEQLLGKKLNLSSDLYSLGITIICLLGGVSSQDINQYINHKFEIHFGKSLPSGVTQQFRNYLKKLVYPNYKQRFTNAITARNELENLEKIPFQKPNRDFDVIHWLVDKSGEKWFSPLYCTLSILIIVTWLTLSYKLNYQEQESLKQNSILMVYQNQKLLLSEYELKEIKELSSYQKITLSCGKRNFHFTSKSSFEYQNIRELPDNIEALTCSIDYSLSQF